MKARWILILVLLVGGSLALVAVFRPKNSTPHYRAVEVTRGDLESRVSATGTLNPVDQVEIGSQVSGTMLRVNVDYNSRVKAGQVLAQIDPAIFRANKSQADANVEKAKVAVKDAERSLGRARDMLNQGIVSQAELDAAETVFETHGAELKQAQASLELADVNLANTTITSPISGLVISRSIDVGQTVAASLTAPKLFVIARDLSEMELEASVDEADIGQVNEGQPVTFTVDSYPDRTFEGKVLQVRAEPIVESGVVSYVTVVRVPNAGGRLLPGMTANVTIITAARDNALRVPNAALRYRPKSDERAGASRQAASGSSGARVASGASGAGAADASPARTGGAWHGNRGAASNDSTGQASWRSKRAAAWKDSAGGAADEGAVRMSTVYILKPGSSTPEAVHIRAGISDGTMTEVVAGALEEGSSVVVGELDPSVKRTATPNPLAGGAQAGGNRGGGARRGGP